MKNHSEFKSCQSQLGFDAENKCFVQTSLPHAFLATLPSEKPEAVIYAMPRKAVTVSAIGRARFAA
jgi:hypothetical protein